MPVNTTTETELLHVLGERVRALRAARALSRKVLAEKSGVSQRYLAQLEQGSGNISVLLLARVAEALRVSVTDLLAADRAVSAEQGLIGSLVREMSPELQKVCLQMLKDRFAMPTKARRRVALVGLRGAGKSTLGRRLAAELDVPFVYLGGEIEQLAGMSASEIFSLSGQAGYRRLEERALIKVLGEYEHCVIETGGSIVTDDKLRETLLGTCFVIWLYARPEEYIERLIRQGDIRPMQNQSDALSDLRQILAEREASYRRAHASLDTSGLTVDECVHALVQAVPETAYGGHSIDRN